MVELNGNIFWGLIQMMNSFKAGTQPFQLAAAIGNCCRACRRGSVLRQKKMSSVMFLSNKIVFDLLKNI